MARFASPLGSGSGGTVTLTGEVGGTSAASTITVNERLDRYVDYVNGNDANDGATPYRAFKTIQAAYNAVKTVALAGYVTDSNSRMGIGRLFLAPGDHNVGTGLSFDARYSVDVIGTRSGRHNHDLPPAAGGKQSSASVITTTSAAATELCLISRAATIGLGFGFYDLGWRFDQTVATSLTKCLYAKIIDDLHVERCSFDTADNSTNTSVVGIYQEDIGTGGDAAWAQIINNYYSRVALYKGATTDGTGAANFNSLSIERNVGFFGGSVPTITIAGAFHGLNVSNNHLEGTATQVYLGPNCPSSTTAYFQNNNGEDDSTGTPPNPFYDIQASVFQLIIVGGSVTTPNAAGAGTFANFVAGASNNLIIGPYDLTGNTSQKRKIVTAATNGVRILDTNAGYMARYIAAATMSDSNYSKTPDNGAWGVTYG